MDESQDTNVVQWEFFNLLFRPDNFNAYVVGDVSQCQPPETLVTVIDRPAKGGGRTGKGCMPATYKQVRIDTLRDGDEVVSWRRVDCRTRAEARKIRVASRPYAGHLCRIETAAGVTRVTPNHWVWTRFNNNADGKYFLYLMRKDGLGYRIGVTKAKRSNSGYGISSRLNVEHGDAAWILKTFETKIDAETWEEIYSLKYGIPESVFCGGGCQNKTQEHIKLIFSHANPAGAAACLADHGLLLDQPLISKETTSGQHPRGYFKTAAANLIPEIMDLPIQGINQSTRVLANLKEDFNGLVYSLDVEEDHTYIADNLVVGNSIYGFNGAAPELLLKFTKGWRGVSTRLYKLERNHRSVPEVVKLANVIQKKMTDTIPLQMISHRGEQGEKGSTKILRASSPREIAGSIAESIFHQNQLKRDRIAFGENAILVRSGTQIRDIETELVRWRVPYVIRGGRGLLQTEEAKDLLAYLRLATNPKDLIAFSRAISVPKRGFGDAAIEKVRKLAEPLGDDLIKGCIKYGHAKTSIWSQFMLDLQTMTGEPVKALAAVVRFTKYDDYVKERYGKDAEKVETKISNIQRLAEMIGGITEANPEATLEDVCFQLTLHASGENESEDGCAVITTIHAAKGLEWKRCFVTNCYEGSLPHQYARTPAEIEEERRLFYVAVTRAKDEAVLCIPSMIQYGPNTRSVDQSRFITEIMPK
jgi:DNA helicase-2/ATP-dependent DNA helicase PcrA